MDNPSFHLEGVVREKDEMQDFEGPLSLILMLLSKNKIEIRDIKISEILDQYLEYLAEMESMDLEIASEFIQMASHLLYIKTKTLLTSEEEVSELEVLMASLEQLKCKDTFAAVQKVTPELKKASEFGLLYFSKLPEPPPQVSKEYMYRHEPVDLLALSKTVSDIIVDRASEAGITIEQSDACKGLQHHYIYGSDLHLQQVFLNIYGNAIKYNKPNGKIVTQICERNHLKYYYGPCTIAYTSCYLLE